MPTVFVQIETQPSSDEVEVVEDLDELIESTKCSCNAGDDNPY